MRIPSVRSRFLPLLLIPTLAVCLCGCPKPQKPAEPKAGEIPATKKSDSTPDVGAKETPPKEDPSTPVKAAKADLGTMKSDRENAVVKSEGAGATRDEALRDAFRNAVRQVVGTFVDEETRTKNDEIISDKVLTYSDGIVKEYEERDVTEKGGIWRAKITARIERGKVVERLQAANVTVKDVDGSGLFAEIVTDLEKSKTAAGMIDKALGRFPLDCMTATLEGKPEVVEKNEAGATVKLNIRISPDLKAYDSFVAKLVKVLSAVKKEEGEFTDTTKIASWYSHRSHHQFVKSPSMFYKLSDSDRKKFMVFVNTHRTRDNANVEWRHFTLDEDLRRPFVLRWACMFGLKLTLQDKAMRTIAVQRYPLNLQTPGMKISLLSITALGTNYTGSKEGFIPQGYTDALNRNQYQRPVSAFVSPYFIADDSQGYFSPTELYTAQIKLSLDEIKSIHNVRVELTFPGTYPPKPPDVAK